MKKENCIFEKIYLFNQDIKKKQLLELIENMYNNICFSTFPYLIYNQENSKISVQKFNSGNCISFCYFIKMYLKKNYSINSYIIPASVASIFKLKGTPKMSHCAIVIPINLQEFYILDGALYFLEPMFCSLKDNKERVILSSNAHRHKNTFIHYSLKKCDKTMIDEKFEQFLPNKTIRTSCYFRDIPNDLWDYYLCEIKNPDYNIGYSFIKNKEYPFIMKTYYQDGIVKLKYKLELQNNKILIYEYPSGNMIYDGIANNNTQYINIMKELHPYFLDYITL